MRNESFGGPPLRRSWWRRGNANCREVGAALQAFLDQEVDDDYSATIAAHLAACKRCGLESSVYEEICAALERQNTPVDDAVVSRLRSFGEGLQNG